MSRFKLNRTVFLILYFLTFGISDVKAHIYGEDNRREIEDAQNVLARTISDSVAAEVHAESISFYRDSTFNVKNDGILEDELKDDKYPICEKIPYLKQPMVAGCTGSLITSQLLLTAGHCIGARDPRKIAWIFGWKTEKGVWRTDHLPMENLRFGSKIIQWKDTHLPFESGVDYALVLLDRPVTGAKPIEIDFTEPKLGSPLMAAGFPNGIPMKWVDGGTIVMKSATMIGTTLDFFEGNSGTLVLDEKTGRAVGIHSWSNMRDFEYDIQDGRTCIGIGHLPTDASERYQAVIAKVGGLKNLDFPRVDPEFLGNAYKIKNIPHLKYWMNRYP